MGRVPNRRTVRYLRGKVFKKLNLRQERAARVDDHPEAVVREAWGGQGTERGNATCVSSQAVRREYDRRGGGWWAVSRQRAPRLWQPRRAI